MYSCELGFSLDGQGELECQDDGTWSSVQSSCGKIITHMKGRMPLQFKRVKTSFQSSPNLGVFIYKVGKVSDLV